MGVVKRLEVGRIALFSLLVLACLILSASANGNNGPTPTPLATVEIIPAPTPSPPPSENLTILDPLEENWIKLHGGETVAIPPVNLVYTGLNNITHVENGTTIKVTSTKIQKNEDYVVPYPFGSHPFYHKGDDVTVEVQLQSGFSEGTCYIYLVKTGPTELRDTLLAGVHGNTAPIRALFANAREEVIPITTTPISAVFEALGPGDYGVAATLNPYNVTDITLISVSALTILEYKSTLNVPTEVTRPSTSEGSVDGEFIITDGSTNATYTYIAALIKSDEKFDLRLGSNGTRAGTNLTLNDALLVDAFKIGGVGLNNINSNTVFNWIKGAFDYASVEKGTETGTTYDFSLPVGGMPDGDYFLYVTAWNVTNPSQRVVALSQEAVRIETIIFNSRGGGVVSGGGGGGGEAPPAPSGITEIPTEPTGEVTSTVTATSADGMVSITILEGTIAKDAAGNPLTQVTVSTPITLPAAAPSGVSYVGYAIELGPAGATFSKPVEISIIFEPADFPPGTTPVIYVFEAGAWKPLATTIVDNKAIAYVDHFSIFVLFAESVAPTPPPTPVVTPTPPVTPAVTPTATPTPLFTSLMLPPLNVVMVIVIAVVVAVLNIAAYRMLRRRTSH